MSVLIVGMSHHSAPVTLLEQVAFSEEQRAEVVRKIAAQPAVTEAMMISTCNRVEVYAATRAFHSGVTDILEVLVAASGVDAAVLRQHLYVRYADAAAEHLFAVAAGLDSLVVGEQQIIGQVRQAYAQAKELGTAGQSLHLLAQCALRTGKRVHSETAIDDAGPSMVSVAVDAASELLGYDSFAGRTAVVLGAGAMSTLAATYLGKNNIGELVICNRTRERADVLVDRAREAGVAARAVDWDQRSQVYGVADIIVSACGAGDFTVTAADLAAARAADSGSVPAGVVCVDLSMPRDIDDAVSDLPGVELVNIEYLRAQSPAAAATSERKALAILAEELGAYSSAQRVRDVAPAVAALRQQATCVVEQELERLAKKSLDFSDEQREEINRTVHRIVDKLLHQPTVAVKELAAHSGTVSYRSALQQLFGLEENKQRTTGGLITVPFEEVILGAKVRRGDTITVAEAVAAAEAAEIAAVGVKDVDGQRRATSGRQRVGTQFVHDTAK